MAQSNIEPFDIERMLFGESPPEFLIEVFFRGRALYLFMLVIMRLLGKRMAGELTIAEMVLMITLGGSVAVAIQVPEGGVLIGFVVLTCAFVFEKLFSKFTASNRKVEDTSEGRGMILIKDGVLQINKMKDARMSREQLFAALRTEKIFHLGQVERMYLEAAGGFSTYKINKDAPAGLAIFPEEDTAIFTEQKESPSLKACITCGNTSDKEGTCTNCNNTTWTSATY